MLVPLLATVALLRVEIVPAVPDFPCSGTIRAGNAQAAIGELIPIAKGASDVVLQSDDCWAAAVPAHGESVRLVAWPKARLSGELRVRRGVTPPGRLEIAFESKSVPRATGTCAVLDRRWTCDVPKTPLDVRLSATGFAPVYLWNAAPDGTPIAIALERGSSISGWLAADDAPLETAIVDVVPEAFAGGRGADERLAFRSRSVKPNARGFFQLTGVAPGEYVVTARMSGRSPATVSRVRVAEGREIALADPLLLEPLARVEVAISPPVDPAGKPWHVALHARQFADRSLVPAGRGTVRREGAWTSDALPRGSYRIAIRDAAGATWHRQPVELEAVDARIDVTLASVPVEGIIRAGTRPLEAELRFESEQAAVEMHSDEEGLFFGSLPRDGEWRVRISPARSRQRIHDVQVNVRRDAELAVDLAGETIEGVVIDEAGNPVANAQVQALRRGRMESHGGTDDAGRFAFIGLKPGELSLYAQSRSGESAPVPVTGADPVTLVVRARTAVSGTLTDASGSPVAGALLRYVGAAGKLSDTATGPNGEFQFDAPPGVEAIDMVVVAPGLPVKLVRIDPRRSPVRLSFTGSAGVLRVGLAGAPPWPTINAGGRSFLAPMLFRPRRAGPPVEMRDGAFVFDVEPGHYTVCLRGGCRAVEVAASREAAVDFHAPP